MKTAATSLLCAIALWVSGPSSVWAQAQTAPKVGAMEERTHTAASLSTNLTVTIDGKATTLSIAELAAMPQTTVTVHNEHTKAEETYGGVLLSTVLAKYGFPVDKTTHQKMLRSYLVAEGTHNYWVVYSMTEVEGTEHDGSVVVATSINGKPLGADGQLKLIDSGDKKPQRWVRNLTSIAVKNAE